MRALRGSAGGATGRALAWIVTGAPGRGIAFAIDFVVALRRGLLRRP